MLTEAQREAQDKQIGKCLSAIERIKMEPEALELVKDIVRKRMRFLAENVAEVSR